MSGTLAAKIIASLAFATIATTALAHARLIKAAPAAGDTVTVSPTEIRLKFSEGIEPRFSGIALTTQNGASEPTGKPTVDPADDSVLVTTVGQALKSGVYKVTWHGVSADTHKSQGSFNFTVAP